MFETEEKQEKIILVGVQLEDGDDTRESLLELAELAKTAGAETVKMIIQNREKIHPGTYIGKGKIEEVKEAAVELEAECIVCDDELSPAQLSNLQDVLGMKVIDRTVMILDIFAAHAFTREGKIQVELAQLKYRATRLVGLRNSLSRLGGGIGTRGPGEKKLEVDRRLVRERISQLKEELREVQKNREVTRKQREASSLPVAAIVGYTNAGKSTLLNRLTGAGVLAEDKLFATLDPTTRQLSMENGQKILMTDTVGFIRKLPHHLVEAFKSTLEEAKYADILVHVVDAGNPQMDTQIQVVYDTLEQLGVKDKKVITVFNKCDTLEDPDAVLKDFRADVTVRLSAKTGEGMEHFLSELERILMERNVYLEKVFPYEDAGKIQVIRQKGRLISEEYIQDGILVKAYVPKELGF
jgi:GTP-binding protein HflX